MENPDKDIVARFTPGVSEKRTRKLETIFSRL